MRLRCLLPLPFALTLLAADPPRLEIQPAGMQKLGSVGPREQRTLTYTFHNRSKAPIALKVSDLPAGLQVSGPALERSIAPEESLALLLKLDPTQQRGWFRRRVKLVTDDPQQGDYLLPLEATIRPDLAVDALRLNLPAAHFHESPEASFHFFRETGEPLSLRLVSTTPEYLETEVIAKGPKAELRVILHPLKVSPGVLEGLESLQVESNVGEQKTFTLYFQWSLIPMLACTPVRLVFEGQDTLALTVKRPDGKAFSLEEARIEGQGFSAAPTQTSGPVESLQLSIKREVHGEARALLVLKVKGEAELQRIPLISLP